MTKVIMAGLIFLPIIGSVIGYAIGYHDAKRKYQKLYRKMTDEEVDRCSGTSGQRRNKGGYMNGYSIEIRNRDGRKKEVTYMGSVPDILSMVLDDCIRDDDTGWFFETGQGDGNMAGDTVLVKGSDGDLYGCEVISAKPVEII